MWSSAPSPQETKNGPTKLQLQENQTVLWENLLLPGPRPHLQLHLSHTLSFLLLPLLLLLQLPWPAGCKVVSSESMSICSTHKKTSMPPSAIAFAVSRWRLRHSSAAA
jgi:hypothetical protein